MRIARRRARATLGGVISLFSQFHRALSLPVKQLLYLAPLLLAGCVSPEGAAPVDGWIMLFNGKDLTGWQETDFAGRGRVTAQNGEMKLDGGLILTGVNYTNTAKLPKTNYEIEYEAKKTGGSDFFGCLTFPVGTTHASFVNGGWGGAVTGISSLNEADASENDTTKFIKYEDNRWYKFRVRVTPKTLRVWMDDKPEPLIESDITDKRVTVRPGEIELSKPLGFATYQTSGVLRNIRLRAVPAEKPTPAPAPPAK